MNLLKFGLFIFMSLQLAQASERIEYFEGEHEIFHKAHPVLVKRIFLDSGYRLKTEDRSELISSRIGSRACVVKMSSTDFQSDEAEWTFNKDRFSLWIGHSGDGSDSAEGVILKDGTQIIEWSHHAREGVVTSVSHEILHPISKDYFESRLGFSRDCL